MRKRRESAAEFWGVKPYTRYHPYGYWIMPSLLVAAALKQWLRVSPDTFMLIVVVVGVTPWYLVPWLVYIADNRRGK